MIDRICCPSVRFHLVDIFSLRREQLRQADELIRDLGIAERNESLLHQLSPIVVRVQPGQDGGSAIV
jgi:hypothetical protein